MPGFKVEVLDSPPWSLSGSQQGSSKGVTPLSCLQGSTPNSFHSMQSLQQGMKGGTTKGMTPLSVMGSNLPTPMSMYLASGGTGLTPTLCAAGYGGLTPSATGLVTPGAVGMTFTPTQFLAAQAVGGMQVPGMLFLGAGGNAGGGQGVWCMTPHAQMVPLASQGQAGDMLASSSGLSGNPGATAHAATPQAMGNWTPMMVNGMQALSGGLSGSTPMMGFGGPSASFMGPLMQGMTPQGASMLSPGWIGQGTPVMSAASMGAMLSGQTPQGLQTQAVKAAAAAATARAAGGVPGGVASAWPAAAGGEPAADNDRSSNRVTVCTATKSDKDKAALDGEEPKRSKIPSQPSSGNGLQAGGILGPLLAGKLPILEKAAHVGTLQGFSPSLFLSSLSPTCANNSPTIVNAPFVAIQQPASGNSQAAGAVAKAVDALHATAAGKEQDTENGAGAANRMADQAWVGVDGASSSAGLVKLSIDGGSLRARRAAKAAATSSPVEQTEAWGNAGGRRARKRPSETEGSDTEAGRNGPDSGGGSGGGRKKRPPALSIGLGGVVSS